MNSFGTKVLNDRAKSEAYVKPFKFKQTFFRPCLHVSLDDLFGHEQKTVIKLKQFPLKRTFTSCVIKSKK